MDERTARGAVLHASIRLGRVGGIPIGLHYSWFILAALIAWRDRRDGWVKG